MLMKIKMNSDLKNVKPIANVMDKELVNKVLALELQEYQLHLNVYLNNFNLKNQNHTNVKMIVIVMV